jgi:hypothetical protein
MLGRLDGGPGMSKRAAKDTRRIVRKVRKRAIRYAGREAGGETARKVSPPGRSDFRLAPAIDGV